MSSSTPVVQVLRDARALILKGWHEPFAVDADGRWVIPLSTGHARIAKWSVEDACHDAAAFGDAGDVAIAILAEVAGYAGRTYGFAEKCAELWNAEPSADAVLGFFKHAILRAQKLEADR